MLVTAVAALVVGYLIAGRPVPAPGAIVFPATTTTTPVDTSVATIDPQLTIPPSTTSVVSTMTSTTTSTTSIDAGIVTPSSESVDRSVLSVGVGNANGIVGSAGSAAEALVRLGYVDVSAFDVGATADVSIVFHADGFRDEAARLAADVGLDPGATAPLALAPAGVDESGLDLVVILGLDRP